MPNRFLCIDGDMVLYSITAACEEATDWGDDVWTLHADAREAKQRVDVYLAELKERLEGDHLRLAFTDYTRPNWRLSVLPSYKANRKGGRKPVVYWPVRQYMFDTYTCSCLPGLEADDVLGLMVTNPKMVGEKILVGEDKDFRGVPGKLYNPNHEDEGIVDISAAEANYFHMFQTLVGDRVDGYGGCPGVGEVTAERELRASDNYWETVIRLYKKAKLGESEALTQARVARILRRGEYDKKTSQVKLWSPPVHV